MKKAKHYWWILVLGLIICLLVFIFAGGLKIFSGSSNNNDGGSDQDTKDMPNPERDSVGLYPASVNAVGGAKWGYIDKASKFVIKPVYNMAGDFQDNGLAVVERNNLSGLINAGGKFVVDPKYDSIDEFSEGLAVAVDSKGFNVLDEKGNVIFKNKDYIGKFHDGMAVIAKTPDSGKWLYGYIDKSGRVIVEPKYESAGDFNNDKAVVKLEGNGYAVIAKNGSIIKHFDYYYVGDISEGLLPFKEKEDSKYGFISDKGKVVIPPSFTAVDKFKDGVAPVDVSEDYTKFSYGLIDRKGNFVIKPEYNDIKVLGDGMAAVGKPLDKDYPFKGSKYAIATREGKILTDYIYYGVSDYDGGLASAYDKNATFFIDKTGKRVSTLPVVSGSGELTFDGGLIKANVDSRISYLERNGKVIWAQRNDTALNSQYAVKEMKYRPNRNYVVYYPQITGMEDKDAQQAVNERLKKMSITEKVDPNAELDYSYQGDFSVGFFKKNLVVIKLTGYNYPFGAAHGMPSMIYAHVDLKSGKFYELKDLFKKNSNYVEKLSNIIKQQIEQQGADSPVWADSYKGIKADQPFFISKDALNIYFNPYEIAPYAAGFPTFTIPFKQISDIINTEGAFWLSFNN